MSQLRIGSLFSGGGLLDLAITDNEALKIAGNGVVRQQAVEALRVMIARWITDLTTESAA